MSQWNFATGLLIGDMHAKSEAIRRAYDENSRLEIYGGATMKIVNDYLIPNFSRTFGRYFALRKSIREIYSKDPNELIDKNIAEKISFDKADYLREFINEYILSHVKVGKDELAFVNKEIIFKKLKESDEAESDIDKGVDNIKPKTLFGR